MMDKETAKRICSCTVNTNSGQKSIEVYLAVDDHDTFRIIDGEPFSTSELTNFRFYATYEDDVVSRSNDLRTLLDEASKALAISESDIDDWKPYFTIYVSSNRGNSDEYISFCIFKQKYGLLNGKLYEIRGEKNNVVVKSSYESLEDLLKEDNDLITKNDHTEKGLEAIKEFLHKMNSKLNELLGENVPSKQKEKNLKLIAEMGAEKVLLDKL